MGLITLPNSVSQGIFLARMTASQSVTSGTLTTAIFDGEVFDTRNQYNNTTGVFTCSVPGYWQFNAFLRITSSAPITNGLLQLTHNTTGYRTQQTIDSSSTATTYGFSTSTVILLAANDTVQVQGQATTTGTMSFAFIGSGIFTSALSGFLIAAT